MDIQFSDDRDVLPETTRRRARGRRRRATLLGRLTILLIALSVVLISTCGGIFIQASREPGFQADEEFLLCRSLEIIAGGWMFSVGASVASFLNVVAWRAPRGMSINGHSFCPRCEVPIAAIDNIPIIGWLRLRGRCLVCRLPIAVKYPAFEAIGGYLFLSLFAVEFLSHGSNLSQEIMPSGFYGLSSNFGQVSSELCWLFAKHLILVSCFLALLMTYLENQSLPIWCVVVCLAIASGCVLAEPRIGDASLASFAIHGFKTRIDAIWFLVPTLAMTAIFLLGAKRFSFSFGSAGLESTIAIGSSDLESKQAMLPPAPLRDLSLFLCVSVLAVIGLGLTPAALVVSLSVVVPVLLRFAPCRNRHRLSELRDYQFWILPTTVSFLFFGRLVFDLLQRF